MSSRKKELAIITTTHQWLQPTNDFRDITFWKSVHLGTEMCWSMSLWNSSWRGLGLSAACSLSCQWQTCCVGTSILEFTNWCLARWSAGIQAFWAPRSILSRCDRALMEGILPWPWLEAWQEQIPAPWADTSAPGPWEIWSLTPTAMGNKTWMRGPFGLQEFRGTPKPMEF